MNGKEEKHTPGPWRWEISLCSKRLHLVGGKTRFDLTVMDFARWGMSGASMRLRDDVENMNIMHRCEKWAKPVPGREHHAEWFQDIDHPDALLIAAAPDLLAALKEVSENAASDSPEMWERVSAAIDKAEGKSTT